MKLLIAILSCITLYGFAQQQSDDSYTRYELLDPSTQSFRIIYEVSAVTAGSNFYYNTLRKGSDHKVDAVIDLATGQTLSWEIINGADAKKSGLNEAQPDVDYLKIKLAHPVPEGGEYRLKIDKTYKDIKSYFTQGDKIVFDRPLGIKRNSIVLPLGYELTKCNYPSQIAMEANGKFKISFINAGSAEVPLHFEAKKLSSTANLKVTNTKPSPTSIGQGRDKSKARLDFTFSERAYQNREIVYFLQQPETHAFRLYHDYTETREGTDKYINVVRAGSKASNPSAKNLDTGKSLKVETLTGSEIASRKLDIGETVSPETEVVVIWYDAVQKGKSTRLRIEETYTDENRYLLHNDDLIFDRSFGRPYNMVVLPEGWFLTSSYIPAIVDQTEEGLIRLNFIGNSPDEMDVHIKARRR